jgi:hypothetical protein
MKFKETRPKVQSILDHLIVCCTSPAGYDYPDPSQAIRYAREVLAAIDAELAKVKVKVAERKRAAFKR